MNDKLLKILYIEDSADDAELIDQEIRRAGYRTQSRRVESAQATRDALQEQPWDLVVCDFSLPGFNGFDALAILNEEPVDIPFIMVSGTVGEDVAVEVIKKGATDYLLKDRLKRMGSAVEHVLETHRIRKEQRKSGEEVRLLARLSLAIGEAEDIDTALAEVLRQVCETAQWKAGEAWVPGDEPQLECSAASYGFDGALREFRNKCREYTFQPGEGAVGTVWMTGQPMWMQDVTTNKMFLRAAMAREAGFISALAIPVLAHREAAAVLVFYMVESRAEDAWMMELVTAVATQLGALFRRKYAEEALRHSQKMEAVGRLAGGVAHDFNNMLTVIKSNAQEVLSSLPANSPYREPMQSIDEACDRSSALVRSMLAFSRKDIVTPQVLKVNDIIQNLKKSLLRVLGNSISLETRLTPEAACIHMDKNRFEQVIMNLIVNARDAMPGGGRITISTARVSSAHPASSGIAHEAMDTRTLRISVADTGTGMSEATRSHLFEPFFTTKSAEKGTGLGLSIVYGIIKEGGGRIHCESEYGQGACFHLYFKEVPCESTPATDAQPQAVKNAGTEYILLVEDQDAVRRSTERLLSRQGYHVLSAANATEAMERLDTHQGPPIVLLLTDLSLPETSGRELADQITRLIPKIGIIYCSGYLEDASIHQGIAAGQIHFLQKPFEVATLVQLVRKVIDETLSL